jgi:hypothetical protein
MRSAYAPFRIATFVAYAAGALLLCCALLWALTFGFVVFSDFHRVIEFPGRWVEAAAVATLFATVCLVLGAPASLGWAIAMFVLLSQSNTVRDKRALRVLFAVAFAGMLTVADAMLVLGSRGGLGLLAQVLPASLISAAFVSYKLPQVAEHAL